MKILHTADLHLGKKLGRVSRLNEQEEAIREIAQIADEREVDVILIAGDIFDASVPAADAERVFYCALNTFSERGRAVVALAGNHDDEKRLCAAKPLAALHGIVLAGEIDYSELNEQSYSDPVPPASLLEVAAAADYLQKQRCKVYGRFGGITVEKDGEKVNIALVPYPSEARLSRWFDEIDYNIPYPERVKDTINKACAFFDDNYNILCTHLFLTKSEGETLGGLLALPFSVLPENANYVALGHVHKRYTVTKKPLAVYPGAPLQYAYDETRDKSVTIVDTKTGQITPVPLASGRKLTETDADNFDECMQKLEFFKKDYVRIRYGGEPLGKDQTLEIKEHPAFNDLVIKASSHEKLKKENRAHLSDGEIFDMYYKARYGTDPTAEMKAAFVELMEELKGETD